jgi:sodium-dependent dicarboxylate transporter 2/3/5
MNKNLKLFIASAIPIVVWLLPAHWIPIPQLSIIEHRLIAIFVFALLFWVLEPIPVFATSVLIIVLQLILISDASFVLFRSSAASSFGVVLSYREIMASFASPIIMLFLGGFFLAAAATKFQLDINLARVLLKPFGSQPKFVLLGLMLITGFFSMFMSNTATTAMMLAILAPVLQLLPPGDRGKKAFVLAIPFAANIGGIGTPIGTPPNVVALKYLTGETAISFGAWMGFAVPYTFGLLFFAWLLLLSFYPPQAQHLAVNIRGQFRRNWQSLTVYVTFVLTVLLWLTDFWHGMNSYVVGMIPVAVFAATKIITAAELKQMSWDVLWLVAGGISLGFGLEKTGLAQHLIASIPFADFSPLAVILMATLLAFMMANLMSHTATANLLLPIMAVLGTTLTSLSALGGARLLILAVTFSCSLGMSLPISTPPNAMAHATGEVDTREMMKSGLIIGAAGMIGIYFLMYILTKVNFL